jgi:D-alanine-D-alanine ligase
MDVIVLHGEIPANGPDDEADVLVQAEAVCEALESLGYSASTMAFGLDLRRTVARLASVCPRFVFNLVETLEGSGRLIHMAPTLLDHVGIDYTGSCTEAIFLTSNKLTAKKLLRSCGIRTPEWFTIEGCPESLPLESAFIIKSVWEHASVGLDDSSVLFPGRTEILREGMVDRRGRLGGDCFAEEFIDGREFNLSILASQCGPKVLPAAEIRFDFPAGKARIVDYAAKWDCASPEYRNTGRSFDFSPEDDILVRELSRIGLECWRLFELRGYARIDFRVDGSGMPWVLEVNANPCLSPDAGFAAAAERAGMRMQDVVSRIVGDLNVRSGVEQS